MNIGAWSFVGCAAGSLVTVVLGVPWTTYIARPAYAPGHVVHAPVSRNQRRHDTRLDFSIPRCGGIAAWTPLWVQPLVGAILYGLGRALATPGGTLRRQAGERHGYESAPLMHQKLLPP